MTIRFECKKWIDYLTKRDAWRYYAHLPDGSLWGDVRDSHDEQWWIEKQAEITRRFGD